MIDCITESTHGYTQIPFNELTAEDVLESFKADLKLRQLRPHTIESYISDARRFLQYNPRLCSVTREDLQHYLQILLNKKLSDSTLKSCFISLNALYDFLVYEGHCSENPIPTFRKRYLSRREVKQKRQIIPLENARSIIRRISHIQDRTLHLLYAKSGMRRDEVLILKVDDLQLSRGQIKAPVTGKRLEYRPIFLDDELIKAFNDFLEWRQEYAKSDYLFISEVTGGKMHKDHPGYTLRKIGAQLGIHNPDGPLDTRLTPHCWRHFFTTHMHRAKMDPEHIKFLRGDVLTREAWQLYNHIDLETVREEYLRCAPRLL
jgi:integrase/recombinase XerD